MLPRLTVLLSRLAHLLRGRAAEPEFHQELDRHLELLTERFIRQGMTPAAARSAARRQFGNTTALVEQRRDMQPFVSWERLARDLRHGLRLFARNPGFAAAALFTLSLGIGANTAIFSLVEGVLLKPQPYQDAGRLVVPATLMLRHHTDRGNVAYADVLDWKAETALFEAVAGYYEGKLDLTGGQDPERVTVLIVDEDYFQVMARPMRYGRPLTLDDNRTGAPPVAVLGYSLWKRRFGGDPGVVGQRIETNGVPRLVVGVAQADSTFPDSAEIFLPLKIAGNRTADVLRRDNHMYQAIARLRAGMSLKEAQSRLTVMGTLIARQLISRAGTNWKLHTLTGYLVQPQFRQALLVLFAAAVLVQLIACVNLANLLLARGAARTREVAIRKALGAGWARLAQQFFVESALLAAGGGLLGLWAGSWCLRGLIHLAPPGVPRLDSVHFDPAVLAYTAAICLASVVIAGLIPALDAAHQDPAGFLHDSSRGASQGLRGRRTRSILVVAELALAVVLLTGAGLLIRTFDRIRHIDPGFPTANLLAFQVALPQGRYAGDPQRIAGFEQIAANLRRIPNVLSVSATSSLPVNGGGIQLGRVFLREGQREPPASSDTPAAWSVVLPGYFETMKIPLLAGRSFTERDSPNSPPVIIISRTMALHLFPNENPLGHRIRSWRDENKYREIVGVVGDIRYSGLVDDIGNNVYVPHAQDSWGRLQIVVRAAGSPAPLVPAIRSQIGSVDRKLSISSIQSMDQVVDDDMAQARFCMFLLSIFGATALLLAVIGIYGVMAYSVAQRTREIGIRMAMGALRSDVFRLVATDAIRLAAVGILIGVAGSLLLTRLIRSLLFGVSPTDIETFVLVSGLLTLVALIAAYFPARRAVKVDPVITLRYE